MIVPDEDRLSELLHSAPIEDMATVSGADVYSAARREQRRRSTRFAMLAAAAVAAVAVVVTQLWPSGQVRGLEPGGTTSVNAPSVSLEHASSLPALDAVSALPSTPVHGDATAQDASRVRVWAQPSGDLVTYTFGVLDGTSVTEIGSVTRAELTPGEAILQSARDGSMLVGVYAGRGTDRGEAPNRDVVMLDSALYGFRNSTSANIASGPLGDGSGGVWHDHGVFAITGGTPASALQDVGEVIGISWKSADGRHHAATNPYSRSQVTRVLLHTKEGNTYEPWQADGFVGLTTGDGGSATSVPDERVTINVISSDFSTERDGVWGWMPAGSTVTMHPFSGQDAFRVTVSDVVGGRQAFLATLAGPVVGSGRVSGEVKVVVQPPGGEALGQTFPAEAWQLPTGGAAPPGS